MALPNRHQATVIIETNVDRVLWHHAHAVSLRQSKPCGIVDLSPDIGLGNGLLLDCAVPLPEHAEPILIYELSVTWVSWETQDLSE